MTDKEEKLQKKCEKDYPEFTEGMESMSLEDLDKRLLQYAKFREETLTAKDNDEDLNKAKELSKELNAPYSDSLKALKIKTAYMHILMRDKSSVG